MRGTVLIINGVYKYIKSNSHAAREYGQLLARNTDLSNWTSTNAKWALTNGIIVVIPYIP
jgi:hypothetical protein